MTEDSIKRDTGTEMQRLSDARIVFTGTIIQKNAVIQIAFVFVMDGVNQIGSVLMEKERSKTEYHLCYCV